MKKVISALLLIVSISAGAQIGGNGVYQVLNVAPSARIAAMGGKFNAVYDHDVNSGFQNPSMLNPQMNKQFALNYLNYFAGINQGYFAYARNFDSTKGTFVAGVQYLSYGQFTAADEAGNILGNFSASDMVFQFGYGHKKGNWTYGSNFKVIYSQLETYKSLGVALDLAGSYVNVKNRFTASLIARNIGSQLMYYVDGNREKLPFEVQMGLTKKLEHAPFRFSWVVHNMQQWDLSYVNPNARNIQVDFSTQKPADQKVSFGDKMMRHMIFGVEAVFSKNFNVRFAYNHKMRQEMKLPDKLGFAGFSWGFSLKLLRMNVSYGNAGFLPKQGSHHFSLLIDTETFFKKRPKKVEEPDK